MLNGGTNFTLDHSFVTDNTGLITDMDVRLLNASGTVAITNNTVGPSPLNGISVDNNNVNMTAFSFSISGSTIRDTVGIATNGIGNDGLLACRSLALIRSCPAARTAPGCG